MLNGAVSTFLAVAVLLFSTSYVFRTLSIQFALIVGLGVLHGLILLPVLLSIFGPAPFASAEPPRKEIEMTGSDEDNVAQPANPPSFCSDSFEEMLCKG